MENIKVITICGSMKFKKQMIQIAEELEVREGYAVIQCVYCDESSNYNEYDIERLGKIHLKKIDISDAIYVVNVNGYIGDSTKKEIAYAKKLQKEVFYLEPLS